MVRAGKQASRLPRGFRQQPTRLLSTTIGGTRECLVRVRLANRAVLAAPGRAVGPAGGGPDRRGHRDAHVRSARRPTSGTARVQGHVHDEHGHIVVLLMTGQHVVEQVLQQLPGPVISSSGALAATRTQLVEAGVETAPAVLHQAVGVEHGGRAGRQPERVLPARAGPAERRARLGPVEHRERPGGEQQRGRVAGVPGLAFAGLGVDDQVGDGRNLLLPFGRGEQPVKAREHRRGPRVGQREGAQSIAHPAHARRGEQPLAHDVADCDRQPPVRQPEHVVPVAAHLS